MVIDSIGKNELVKLFDKVAAPDDLTKFFFIECRLDSIDLFLDYVVRAEFEQELKEIVAGKFKVAESFSIVDQRLYISKARWGLPLGT